MISKAAFAIKTTNADAEDVDFQNVTHMPESNIIYIPPLNRKVDCITLPSANPSKWINDNFEERIRNNYSKMVERGLIEKPWYHF